MVDIDIYMLCLGADHFGLLSTFSRMGGMYVGVEKMSSINLCGGSMNGSYLQDSLGMLYKFSIVVVGSCCKGIRD